MIFWANPNHVLGGPDHMTVVVVILLMLQLIHGTVGLNGEKKVRNIENIPEHSTKIPKITKIIQNIPLPRFGQFDSDSTHCTGMLAM
jgi:hypothetical protein